jgi:hypothetical protein
MNRILNLIECNNKIKDNKDKHCYSVQKRALREFEIKEMQNIPPKIKL